MTTFASALTDLNNSIDAREYGIDNGQFTWKTFMVACKCDDEDIVDMLQPYAARALEWSETDLALQNVVPGSRVWELLCPQTATADNDR